MEEKSKQKNLTKTAKVENSTYRKSKNKDWARIFLLLQKVSKEDEVNILVQKQTC